ncbi:hypothetical protein [Blastococcus sp. CCUG 61487]|uniref:hypothetical protein n=1 Tax=Blastococcus sp. CCUG 61487 TaxID=1840703 RepID=UPI0010BFC0D5|nr:hypothetical protein [Blastococcus sp. CCUG 61487]TKJ33603.1 hypothetical protein A6V29_15750 [Blastococcus sp. CCUG 61487]
MRRAALGLVFATSVAVVAACGGGIRGDLSSRDQELCAVATDDGEAIGYLSGQIDELIENDGNFSSESDAYAFVEVPVGRSEQELSSRIANFDEPDSAGYVDDPDLLDSAKALREVLFDLKVAADEGGTVDEDVLADARDSIDDLVDVCT